jgi:hypothetical protein
MADRHPYGRGLDNRVYYMLAPEGQYYNYSGCGNTFNCNHPQVHLPRDNEGSIVKY